MRPPLPLALLATCLIDLGCQTDGVGARCRLDSDCDDGLLCALDGVCQTPAAVADAFVVRHDIAVVTVSDADVAPEVEATETDEASGDCPPVTGVFEPRDGGACPTAPLVRKVLLMQLATEGHGLEQLAGVANQVLTTSFESGESKLELRVDGSLDIGCAHVLAWVRDARDVQADCTPVHMTTMPFEVPNLVYGVIEAAVFDPTTNRVTGRVDKETLVASLEPELRPVAESLIQEDLDLDGDTLPDRASVILTLTF